MQARLTYLPEHQHHGFVIFPPALDTDYALVNERFTKLRILEELRNDRLAATEYVRSRLAARPRGGYRGLARWAAASRRAAMSGGRARARLAAGGPAGEVARRDGQASQQGTLVFAESGS